MAIHNQREGQGCYPLVQSVSRTKTFIDCSGYHIFRAPLTHANDKSRHELFLQQSSGTFLFQSSHKKIPNWRGSRTPVRVLMETFWLVNKHNAIVLGQITLLLPVTSQTVCDWLTATNGSFRIVQQCRISDAALRATAPPVGSVVLIPIQWENALLVFFVYFFAVSFIYS